MVAQAAGAGDGVDTGQVFSGIPDRSRERWFCEKLRIRAPGTAV
jgi:hypothetical protein